MMQIKVYTKIKANKNRMQTIINNRITVHKKLCYE